MQKIGIYSGTFDPVHDGHVAFAKEAAKQAGLDKVYFLVEPCPRYKQGVRAFEHRVAMMQLAIADEPGLGTIVLEQQRFTVHETWPVLADRFGSAQLNFLMGEDVFLHLSHWPHVDELAGSVRFVVGLRNRTAQDMREHLAVVEQTKGLHVSYMLFTPSRSNLSSTKIRLSYRRGIAREGLSRKVEAYIAQEGLYTPNSSSSA